MTIGAVGPAGLTPATESIRTASPAPTSGTSFTQLIDRLLGDANIKQAQSDQAVRDLAIGKADNLHNVMLAVVKADLSFRMVLEVRNRLTDAYQEIMRMQV
jgi:flagellar hook-basal body complex protein FliE